MVPSDEFVPSLIGHVRVVTEEQQGCPNSDLSKQNARDYICCAICSKPRAIYRKKALDKREKRHLARLKLDVGSSYTCGCVLVPEGSYFDSKDERIFTRLQMDCQSPIEVAVYGSVHITVDKDICSHCGKPATVDPETKKAFASIHPICDKCSTDGKTQYKRKPRAARQPKK